MAWRLVALFGSAQKNPAMMPRRGCCQILRSALQVLQFIRLARPILSVGQRFLHLGDAGPDFRQFSVELKEDGLVFREFILGEDGIDGTLRLAQGTPRRNPCAYN
jgi:hypothetical protein